MSTKSIEISVANLRDGIVPLLYATGTLADNETVTKMVFDDPAKINGNDADLVTLTVTIKEETIH